MPAAIVVVPDSLRLPVNDTARLRAVVLNVQGDTLANAPIAFSSEDTTIATVDAGGLVRARAGGVSDMTITSGAVTAIVRVRVRINGTLVVTPRTSLIRSTDTMQLTVVVRDSTGATVTNPSVQYRSPDTTVVRVLPSGKVLFGGSAGTVIIHVSSEGRTDGAFVTAVVARVGGVEGSLFAVNPAGDLLAYVSGYFSRMRLPDTVPIGYVHDGLTGYGTLALDQTASRAYVGDDYWGTLTVLDVAADTLINVIQASHAPFNPRPPYAFAVAPNGQLYYNADSAVYRLAVGAMSATRLFPFGRAYHTVIRDTLLYVSGDADIREFNIRTGALGRQFPDTRYAYDLALNPNGTRLYNTTTSFSTLRIGVWDLTTGDTLPSMSFPGYSGPGDYSYSTLAVQPTTGLLWIITGAARIIVVDPSTRRIVRELRPGGQPRGIAFAASGLGVLGNGQGWLDFVR